MYIQDIAETAKQYSVTAQAIEVVPIPFGSSEDLTGWVDAATYINEDKMFINKAGVYLINYNRHFKCFQFSQQ